MSKDQSWFLPALKGRTALVGAGLDVEISYIDNLLAQDRLTQRQRAELLFWRFTTFCRYSERERALLQIRELTGYPKHIRQAFDLEVVRCLISHFEAYADAKDYILSTLPSRIRLENVLRARFRWLELTVMLEECEAFLSSGSRRDVAIKHIIESYSIPEPSAAYRVIHQYGIQDVDEDVALDALQVLVGVLQQRSLSDPSTARMLETFTRALAQVKRDGENN